VGVIGNILSRGVFAALVKVRGDPARFALAVGPHWQGLEGAAAAVVLADAAVGVPVLAVIMRVLSVGLRELGAPCYGPPPDGRASLSPYLRGVNCSEGCPKASS
jgi:hypothetical protein